MTTNMQQGAQATNAQPGSGADASAGGAGGGQQGVVAGVSQFNPSAGVDALGGGGNVAKPGDTGGAQGKPNGGADASAGSNGQQQPDVKALQQQLEAASTKAAQLQAELDKAIGKRQEAKTSKDELSASVDKLTRENRMLRTVDAVLEKLPASKAKLAKAVVLGLPNSSIPIDLAGEDRAAVVKSVLDRLKEDHPDLLVEPTSQPSIPKIKGASTGPNGVTAQRLGVTNAQGERLL
jgi:hypothetical protein